MKCWPWHEVAAGFEWRRADKQLCKRWAYERVHQVGSHVILQTPEPSPHRVAIPAHSPLRVETLNAILSAVAVHKGVIEADVLKGF